MPAKKKVYLVKKVKKSALSKKIVKSMIAKAIRPLKDIRYIDDDTGANAVGSTGFLTLGILPVPPRGDATLGGRTGDVIYLTEMRMILTVEGVESIVGAADIYNRFAWRLFFLKNNNGSATPPTVAGGAEAIFDTSGTSGSGEAYAPWGINMRSRVQPITEGRGLVVGVDYTVATSNIQFVKEHVYQRIITKKWKKPVKIVFSASDSDLQSTFIGKLPMFACISDSTAPTHPNFQMQTRFFYYA